jgi:hypothetical protein
MVLAVAGKDRDTEDREEAQRFNGGVFSFAIPFSGYNSQHNCVFSEPSEL